MLLLPLLLLLLPLPAQLIARQQRSLLAVLLALAFFPILADSPRSIPPLASRPHVALVATSTVLVLAAWVLSELSVTCSTIAKRAMAAACIGLVAWWCIGARSSSWHGIVAPRAAQVSFLRSATGHSTEFRFVIAHIAVSYLAEAQYPGEYEVGLGVSRFGTKSFDIGCGLFLGDRCFGDGEFMSPQAINR